MERAYCLKQKRTRHADVEEVSPGRTLAGVGVEVEQHRAQYGEKDAPRMRRRVHLRIDDVRLAARLVRLDRVTGSSRCVEPYLFRIRVAHELPEVFAIGHQKQT